VPSSALVEARCLPRDGRGVLRWLALAVLVAAPVFVIVVFVVAGLLWEIVLTAAAVAAGRTALRSDRAPATPRLCAASQLGDARTNDTAAGPPICWREAGFSVTASSSGRSGSRG
jgi:hypothetical protein